jgi:glycosyltransferase involved in cell wall biosynthesis
MKKLTIVTIVRNDSPGLSRTIQSVFTSGVKCEHLIIDGSDHRLSTPANINYLRHIWGCDQGISDAFNKGILLSTGKYILFLNAGDELLPNTGQMIGDALTDNSLDCAWFSVYRILEGGQKIIYIPRLKYLRFAMSAPHQGLILRKAIFSEIGKFPLQKFSMDHYVALRIITRHPKYKIQTFSFPIATYPSGGHSSMGGDWPFIYNAWNTLRIRPYDFPLAFFANLFLMAKSRCSRWNTND